MATSDGLKNNISNSVCERLLAGLVLIVVSSMYLGQHVRALAAPLLSGHESLKEAVLLVRIIRTLHAYSFKQ